jgi:acetyltransferase-like isoleucine patch superfamily enzyme
LAENKSEVIAVRNINKQRVANINPLWTMYRHVSKFKVLKQTIVIEICRYLPSLKLKRWMYRHLLKMTVGEHTAFAYKVVPDIMYPEYIHIGQNSIVGYNTVLLTHEFLVDEFRTGKIYIGDNTMIGANVTVLPGVTIGSNVKVGAGCIVTKDIPNNALAYGNPLQIVNQRDK